MRVALRADAGFHDGTGHVMRVLTLAETLRERGHDPQLVTTAIDVPWLAHQVADSGLDVHIVDRGDLATDLILGLDPDRVVVDSYAIPADGIGLLDARVPVLAIVDGDARGIRASLYLDQNLGADERPPAADPDRMLRGSAYALIRRDVVAHRRPEPWRIPGEPRILGVLGGTDPTGAGERVASALGGLGPGRRITMVVPEERMAAVREAVGPEADVRPPTTALPELLGSADIVVSAAGTSAWEICTLAIPAVLIAVAENQRDSLAAAIRRKVALGIDASADATAVDGELLGMVRRLVDDEALRRALSEAAGQAFDGRGSERVVEALEKAGKP